MKTKRASRILSLGCIVAMSWLTACQEEDRLSVQDAQDINEEALTDSYFKDVDDMGNVSFESTGDQYSPSGRVGAEVVVTVDDDRFNCEGVTVTLVLDAAATYETPKGTITVDFGTSGCTDLRGNIRKGKVQYAYVGRRFQPNSTLTITPIDYYINGVKLEGTRVVTNITTSTEEAPKFNAVLTNGKATFSDGTIATRESDITWSWVRGTTRLLDKLVIDDASTASGTTRGGRDYTVSLLEDLVYDRTCFIAVDGIKKYVLDGQKEITIDYGTGDCQEVAVTVNGVTRSLRVN